MKHQPPGGCGRVDVLGQGPETRAFLTNGLHDSQQILQGPAQTVVFCHRHHVAVAELVQHSSKLFSLRLRAGNLLRPDTLCTCRLQRLGLRFKVLVFCRDSCVSQDHAKNLQKLR